VYRLFCKQIAREEIVWMLNRNKREDEPAVFRRTKKNK
jgi:hypothetical protein